MLRFGAIATASWIPLSLGALWVGLTTSGAVDPLFLPPPTKVWREGSRLFSMGELQAAIGQTLVVMAAGYSLGSFGGVLAGLAMGGSQFVRASLDPLISALLATPKLSLLPLLMLLLGLGAAPRLSLVALTCFLVTALAALDAVRGISQGYVDLARNYGAGRLEIFTNVLAPAALPVIFTGLRLAAGRALAMTIAVELVSGEKGVGGLIWVAWQSYSTDRLFVGLFTAAGLGMLLHLLLRRLEKKAVPWQAEA